MGFRYQLRLFRTKLFASHWQGFKDGRFPKPVKLGKRVTVWRVEDIRRLLETGGPQDGPPPSLAVNLHPSQL
jgi:hypothetical protein